MSTIGFIGLGIMGTPMSRNLLKAGYDLIVYDVVQSAVDAAVAAGAQAAASSGEVASRCDTVITMLPNGPHVRQAILGENGVLAGGRPNALIIDMSAIDPAVAQEVGKAVQERGLRFLDAPVSGGEPKAIDGTLSIMIGGADADFQEALPMLQHLGASVVRCGDVGAGNVTKLANQIIVALNIAAMSEAMVLATKSGVDAELVYQAIRGGLAGSTVLDAKMPMALARNIKPGFRVELHIKDLANALAAGHEVGSPLPLTAQVMEIMQALKVDGMDKADHSAIIRYYERLAQVEVGKA